MWGSPDDISSVADKIVDKAKQNKRQISKIWTEFPQFKTTIVKKSFDKVFRATENIVFGHTSEIKQNLADNKVYLDALKNNKFVKISYANDREEEVMQQLRDHRKQLAYKVG